MSQDTDEAHDRDTSHHYVKPIVAIRSIFLIMIA